ncbi:MAG: capsule assembly Wzi family protein [Muribaculaceae bacterium]|nr:capsule assembly Wzi family protein [Muribaculaceae bacterium]
MKKNFIVWAFLIITNSFSLAQQPIDYEVSTTFNTSSNGSFAPYYIASNVHGVITQSRSAIARAAANSRLDLSRRFSYGYGIDIIGSSTTSTAYQFFNIEKATISERKLKPASAWIQQLYGEIKYRSIFLTVGAKEYSSPLFNSRLGSDDFIQSGNAQPIPEVRLGFVDFQNIPFTNGWVQIQGEYSIGKQFDSSWLEEHYNYLNSHITTDIFHSYKRLYFRTKPSLPFSLTIGMQSAVQLGGTTRKYTNGIMSEEHTEKITFKSFLHTIIPGSGNSSGNDVYYDGNNLGSWDIVGRYRLNNGDEIKGYFQFPFEDGSGIGKMNGFDGIYGIEYHKNGTGYINGAVIEYIDFRNQSGPMHWAPADHNLTGTLPNQATGADDYYNNFQYNGYQYYGMAIGTPFIKSPIYNQDGYMLFTDNRIQGFHAGITGNIIPQLQYRALVSYRRSLGTPFIPNIEILTDTSFMLEAVYDCDFAKGIQAKCQVAFDRGSLYGNNFGALLSVSYRGKFNF